MKQLFDCKRFMKLSQTLVLSFIALLSSSVAANALPGQNLTAIRQWTKASFVLPPDLVYNP